MALQVPDNLGMVGLGVLGDAPVNPLQPKSLVDGIHLRWTAGRRHGFPWYGYHLFRRHHLPGEPVCLAPYLAGRAAGPQGTSRLELAGGSVSSDAELILTDELNPGGTPGFDLAARCHLRFDLAEAERCHRVELRIGFRGDPGRWHCVDFAGWDTGEVDALREHEVSGAMPTGVVYDEHGAVGGVDALVAREFGERQGKCVGPDRRQQAPLRLPRGRAD